jgi:integrase
MPGPILIGKIFYYRQRVPRDMIPVAGRRYIKESLETSSPALARERFTQCAAKYAAYWEQVRNTALWTGRETAGLAGEVYREFYNRWRDHDRHFWAAHHWAVRSRQLAIATDQVGPKAPLPDEDEALATLERDAGEALDNVLKRSGMVVGDVVRRGLLMESGKAVLLAMERILRECDGDYSPDEKEKRFPPFVAPKNMLERSPLAEAVFEAASTGWKPATIDKYRRIFDDFLGQLPSYGLRKDRNKKDWDLQIVERAHVRAWVDGLLTRLKGQTNARTIEREYLGCIKAIFAFAAGDGRLKENPAEGIRVHAARRVKPTKMRGFDDGEAEAILAETLVSQGDRPARKTLAARRWGPWLCAYTGARIVEIMQLRGMDIRRRDGMWCVRISPEAGTQKSDAERDVPLHEHLIVQGFVEYARLHRPTEPLFHAYEFVELPETPEGGDEDARLKAEANAKANAEHRLRAMTRAQSIAGNLSKWVRTIGVIAPKEKVDPNHGWRHRFKSISLDFAMEQRVVDGIQGHTQPTAAGVYVHPSPKAMMKEIEKLPRIAVAAEPWMKNPVAHPWLPPNHAEALAAAAKTAPRARRAG